jgi:hypothetical protein
MDDGFEHGLMVGVSFLNNSIASVLSFVPFTARQAEYQRLGWALSHRMNRAGGNRLFFCQPESLSHF